MRVCKETFILVVLLVSILTPLMIQPVHAIIAVIFTSVQSQSQSCMLVVFSVTTDVVVVRRARDWWGPGHSFWWPYYTDLGITVNGWQADQVCIPSNDHALPFAYSTNIQVDWVAGSGVIIYPNYYTGIPNPLAIKVGPVVGTINAAQSTTATSQDVPTQTFSPQSETASLRIGWISTNGYSQPYLTIDGVQYHARDIVQLTVNQQHTLVAENIKSRTFFSWLSGGGIQFSNSTSSTTMFTITSTLPVELDAMYT